MATIMAGMVASQPSIFELGPRRYAVGHERSSQVIDLGPCPRGNAARETGDERDRLPYGRTHSPRPVVMRDEKIGRLPRR